MEEARDIFHDVQSKNLTPQTAAISGLSVNALPAKKLWEIYIQMLWIITREALLQLNICSLTRCDHYGYSKPPSYLTTYLWYRVPLIPKHADAYNSEPVPSAFKVSKKHISPIILHLVSVFQGAILKETCQSILRIHFLHIRTTYSTHCNLL
jgi:hypothetical protein